MVDDSTGGVSEDPLHGRGVFIVGLNPAKVDEAVEVARKFLEKFQLHN
jgi:hypothetical protein